MIILIQGLTKHLTRIAGLTVLDSGHECLLLMMAYNSIGQRATVREDQSSTS
jgi:hypothetical protein